MCSLLVCTCCFFFFFFKVFSRLLTISTVALLPWSLGVTFYTSSGAFHWVRRIPSKSWEYQIQCCLDINGVYRLLLTLRQLYWLFWFICSYEAMESHPSPTSYCPVLFSLPYITLSITPYKYFLLTSYLKTIQQNFKKWTSFTFKMRDENGT